MKKERLTTIGNVDFYWGRMTYIMGIINASSDSFSGDGVTDVKAALEQAERFIEEGADILDIGGESTRPGAPGISAEEEIKRVIPVIETITRETKIPVSVDTSKFEVAERALAAGASLLNDQWGLKKEPALAKLAAAYGVPLVLMANQRDRGDYDPGVGRDTGFYDDVMAEVINNLKSSISKALDAGVPEDKIIIDPGIGFGKTWQQDIEVVRRLGELKVLEKPVLIGPSRKSLIKMVLKTPVQDRA